MNRAEFMARLTALLGDVPPTEREEAIQYYNDYFDDAGEENEQGVIASLGSPEELARSIKAGLFDGGNAGEFTESGFRGYEERRKAELMKVTRQEEQTGNPQNGGWQNGNPQSGGWQNGNPQSTGWQNGNPQSGGWQNGNPQSSGWQNGNQQNGGWQNGNPQTGDRQTGSNPPPKKQRTGGQIALICCLVILASPFLVGLFGVAVGLLGGIFGGSVGLFAGLFGIFIAFLVAGVVLIVVGIALIVTGIAGLFGAPLGGMALIGGGLILIAVGLVCTWLMVLVVGTVIPALIRGIVSLCRKFLGRGGAQV